MVFWEGYVSDETMGTFAPIVLYWIYGGFYQLLPPMDRFRLHTRQEEAQKNLVSLRCVVKGVLLQQFFQATVAQLLFLVLMVPTTFLFSLFDSKSLPFLTRLKPPSQFQNFLLHKDRNLGANNFMITSKANLGVPTTQPSIFIQLIQFLVAMFIMDTWQYFVHRYMHQNKFLYRHIHSKHHSLIVPYAIGALYNHPLEGLLLDTVGGVISFLVSGMTARTAVFFFCFAVIKTVDDHCGLWLPGNIFHLLFQNNTAYHDIHHQLQGLKYNYSQPFFPIWDHILGTHMPYNLVKREEGGFEARPATGWKEE